MDLSTLPVRDGFRMRGESVTRLETFVDAAFAFAVTLLVVSFEAMPSTFAELYDALRRLPAFLAGFAIIALFWHAHHRFSRRFGLEEARQDAQREFAVPVELHRRPPISRPRETRASSRRMHAVIASATAK